MFGKYIGWISDVKNWKMLEEVNYNSLHKPQLVTDLEWLPRTSSEVFILHIRVGENWS